MVQNCAHTATTSQNQKLRYRTAALCCSPQQRLQGLCGEFILLAQARVDIEELINKIDTDLSGEIEFEEFKALLS